MKVLMESTRQSLSIIQSAVCNYSDAEEDLPTFVETGKCWYLGVFTWIRVPCMISMCAFRLFVSSEPNVCPALCSDLLG